MKTTSASSNVALILSAAAFLTGVARLILEIRFVPEIASALVEDQPAQTALVMFVLVAFFGGWLWALLLTARDSRRGLVASLIFALILALAWGLPTITSFCPTPCPTAAPLTDIVTWSNVIVGLIAALALGRALRSSGDGTWRLKIETPLIVALYRPLGRWMGSDKFLLLTTTGRKSHRQHTVPLVYMPTDGGYVVTAANIGSDAQPGWFLNLKHEPQVQIQIGDTKMTMRAEDSDSQTREHLWARWIEANPGYARFQAKTARQFPLVILKPMTLFGE